MPQRDTRTSGNILFIERGCHGLSINAACSTGLFSLIEHRKTYILISYLRITRKNWKKSERKERKLAHVLPVLAASGRIHSRTCRKAAHTIVTVRYRHGAGNKIYLRTAWLYRRALNISPRAFLSISWNASYPFHQRRSICPSLSLFHLATFPSASVSLRPTKTPNASSR